MTTRGEPEKTPRAMEPLVVGDGYIRGCLRSHTCIAVLDEGIITSACSWDLCSLRVVCNQEMPMRFEIPMYKDGVLYCQRLISSTDGIHPLHYSTPLTKLRNLWNNNPYSQRE